MEFPLGVYPEVLLERGIPHWSCEDSLSLGILRHLMDEGFLVAVQGHSGGWLVSLAYPAFGKQNIVEHHASSSSLSVAICLAALQAVGITEI